MIGEIKIWLGNTPPPNFMFCNGDLLTIENNKALFDMIGTEFGGDGIENFALPNMNEGGSRFIVCINGVFFI